MMDLSLLLSQCLMCIPRTFRVPTLQQPVSTSFWGLFSPCLLPHLWEGLLATAGVHTWSVMPEEVMEEVMPLPNSTKGFWRRCINTPAPLPPEQKNTPILQHFIAFPHGNNLLSSILTAGLKTEGWHVTACDQSVGSERQHLNWALAEEVGASAGGHQGCACECERTLSRWKQAGVSDRLLCSALCQVRGCWGFCSHEARGHLWSDS